MQFLKTILTDFAKKNALFRFLLRKVLYFKRRLGYVRFLHLPVNNHLILFECFDGRQYCDSPKAIYEALLKDERFNDYQFVWMFRNPENHQELLNNERTTIYQHGTAAYKRTFATAKYWIVNAHIPSYFTPRKETIFLQCWHGTPLKRLGLDIALDDGNAMNSIQEIHQKYIDNSKKYTYFLSPSGYASQCFKTGFALKDEHLIEVGYPRNDFMSNYANEDVAYIKERIGLPHDKKVMLYAPTFRDNQHQSGLGYVYDTKVDFDALKEKFSDEYVILFRAHYLVANGFDFNAYQGFVYNVGNYDDINHLYVISDLLITDYSSVMFDYSILRRPMIFYMYDLDIYQGKLRDFYMSLDLLPGPIVKDEKALMKAIEASTDFVYDEAYQRFNDTFTYNEDGKATLRVINQVFNKE